MQNTGRNLKGRSLLAVLLLAVFMPAIALAFKTAGTGIVDAQGRAMKAAAAYVPGLLAMEEKSAVDVLAKLSGAGVKYVRILASFCGDSVYSLQPKPGVYNEEAFEKMDRIIAAAGKAGIKLTLALGDGSDESSSKKTYSAWAGGSNQDVFFKDRITMNLFRDFIKQVLTRTNTATKTLYASDPAIFSYDLCNSASNDNDPDGSVMYAWASEMSAYVRSLDKTHLITINLDKNGFDAAKINNYDIALLQDIDYVTCGGDGSENVQAVPAGYFSNSGRPVAAIIAQKPSEAAETAGNFIAAGGSMAMIRIDQADEAELAGISEAAKKADLAVSTVKPLSVKDTIAVTGTDSVQIKIDAPSKAVVRIAYGISEPLKNEIEAAGGSAVIKGLTPATRYEYRIKAALDSSGSVSALKSFTTKPLVRLKSLPFKMSANFIKVKNGAFYDGARKYRYLGANNYYIRHVSRELCDEIFKEAAAVGIKVIRIGSNGEAESMDAIDKNSVNRFFRIGPDYFNEEAYKEFDYVLDSAARHGIRVIIHFTDYWEYYGGVAVYSKWAGLPGKDMFFTDEKCKQLYKQTVDSFIMRKNTVNKKIYRDDPVIFAYDLMNEPEDRADITAKTLTEWINEMSAYIKTKDGNHMVTTGMEGYTLKSDGTHYSGSDFTLCQQSGNIDFATFHIYPASVYTNYSPTTTAWMLANFIKTGHEKLGKPVVMEEFGIPNNNPDYPKAKWIKDMIEGFFKEGGDGANYWFFIDPTYKFGDGNEVNYTQTEYMNTFIKTANELNKDGY